MPIDTLLSPAINDYLDAHTHATTDLLLSLEQDTIAQVPGAHMISGHLQGNLLSMISKILRPRCVLEIGTYTGYAAIALSDGLDQDGVLYSIERDVARRDMISQYWDASPKAEQMHLLIGDAHDIIPSLDIVPDLIFLDADKKGYAAYYDMLIDKMPSGGVILADNVLFHGEIFRKTMDECSNNAKHMHLFNEKIANDTRVEVVILPIRDGISLIRKR